VAKSENKAKPKFDPFKSIDKSLINMSAKIEALEDVVAKLLKAAHICRNCVRVQNNTCLENNRPIENFGECSFFARD